MKRLYVLLLLSISAVFVILLVVGSVFMLVQKSQSKNAKTAAAQAEVKRTVEKVSQLMVLPQNEEPTVATVADKAKLDSQPFFKNAQNGDKVLIYVQAGTAILYRPSINKIVTVAPVQTVQNESVTPSPVVVTTQKTQSAQVILYNGTTKSGLTFTIEQQLTKQFQDIEVSDRVAASKTDYAKTLVVDVSGKFPEAARDLAEALSAEVGPLPDGEKKPTADILIIVGKDQVL